MRKAYLKPLLAYLCLCTGLGASAPAFAQGIPTQIPGAADAARVEQQQRERTTGTTTAPKKSAVSTTLPTTPIPEGAKDIHFVLKDVNIVGITAFTPAQLRDIYQNDIGHEITLDRAYTMAGAITERYRSNGYFLSLAYVPDQELQDGILTLKVVEGYVGDVELDSNARNSSLMQGYIYQIRQKRPIKSAEMESFLLRLNDIPGFSYKGVLAPFEGGPEGAVKLSLVQTETEGKGSITFDNFSSRFLGPNELTAAYEKSFIPGHQTSFSILAGLPTRKLNYVSIQDRIALAPAFTLDVNASYTKSQPGFNLAQYEIKSDSKSVGVGINYQVVRQRDKNVTVNLSADARNSSSELLQTPFSEDRIRAVRAGVNADWVHPTYGYTGVNMTLSQGIDGFGSSDKGDFNLSRAEAEPDFTKLNVAATHLQAIIPDWSLLATAAGQYSSGHLFSAEEFGFGGPSFGRAYDFSEITGDQGISAGLELRYDALVFNDGSNLQPYAFYDIGRVWNDDAGQVDKASAASGGGGVRGYESLTGLSGNLGLAWPLTRKIETPIYGQGTSGPRVILQVKREL